MESIISDTQDEEMKLEFELNGNLFIFPHPKGHLNKCIGYDTSATCIQEVMCKERDYAIRDDRGMGEGIANEHT